MPRHCSKDNIQTWVPSCTFSYAFPASTVHFLLPSVPKIPFGDSCGSRETVSISVLCPLATMIGSGLGLWPEPVQAEWLSGLWMGMLGPEPPFLPDGHNEGSTSPQEICYPSWGCERSRPLVKTALHETEQRDGKKPDPCWWVKPRPMPGLILCFPMRWDSKSPLLFKPACVGVSILCKWKHLH